MLIIRNRTDGLPPSIEIEIIGRQYSGLAQILCVAACVIVGATIMATRTGDPLLWAIVGAAVVVSGLRVIGVLAFERRSPKELTLAQAHRWENLYAAAALVFTLVIAVLTLRIFNAGYTDGNILTVGLAMGVALPLNRFFLTLCGSFAVSEVVAMGGHANEIGMVARPRGQDTGCRARC